MHFSLPFKALIKDAFYLPAATKSGLKIIIKEEDAPFDF